MTANPFARVGVFIALVALMALTRSNHFGAIPDASWAVFLAAGFYLRGQWRWAFPLLMLEAVLVDFAVIRAAGIDFFSHYCVSPGYWALLPAYLSMWLGGAWLAIRQARPATVRLLQLGVATVLATALCHLFAQGGFYWLSDSVAQPDLAGWWKNYGDWLLPYLRTTAVYTAAIAVLHVAAASLFVDMDARASRPL